MQKQRHIPWAMVVALALGAGVMSTGCASWSNMDEETTDSEQPVQDTWITTKVMAEFAAVDGIDSSDLDVETSNGVVTVTGRVESEAEVDSLVAAAHRVDGVTGVNTDMLTIVED